VKTRAALSLPYRVSTRATRDPHLDRTVAPTVDCVASSGVLDRFSKREIARTIAIARSPTGFGKGGGL
jgi:hypothetical protein